MLLTPKGHQLLEADHLTGIPGGRGLLLSETGTGKTITLGLIAQRIEGRTLWLTEKSLMTQTQQVLTQQGLSSIPHSQVGLRNRITDFNVILATHGEAKTRLDGLTANGPWALLVIDEAQILGGGGANREQKTYQAIKELSHYSQTVIASTAEPIGTAHLLDLWAIGDAIGVPGWPSRIEFECLVLWQEVQRVTGRFTITESIPTGVTEEGRQLLFRCVARIAIRTTLDQVVDDLPSLIKVEHPVALSVAAARNYASVNVGGLEGHQARTKISRDQTVLIPRVLQLLQQEYADHQSVVVYTEQFDLLDSLEVALSEAGISSVRLTGQQSIKQRDQAMDLHRSGKVRCLIGTEALEAGLNVQHASLLISVVQSYNPAREKQREGRLRRIGSPHSSITHAVVYPDVSLEERRQSVLERKALLANQLFALLAERPTN